MPGPIDNPVPTQKSLMVQQKGNVLWALMFLEVTLIYECVSKRGLLSQSSTRTPSSGTLHDVLSVPQALPARLLMRFLRSCGLGLQDSVRMCIASANPVPVQGQVCKGPEVNEALPARQRSLFQCHLGDLAGHGQRAAKHIPCQGKRVEN